jgi:LysR family carnitine catabolism transcriptional activator
VRKVTVLPTLRQLKVFLAIARFRNFSRAAQALGLSQSALSQALAQMEYLLDTTLVQRNRRSLVLTLAGERFLPRADRILKELSVAIDELKDGADQAGHVSVSCLSSILLRILPRVVDEFQRRSPMSVIHIREEDALGIVNQINNGAVDFAISVLFRQDPAVHFLPLIEDRFRLVCRRDHELATREKITWAELEKFDFVGMAHWTGVSQLVDRAAPAQMTRAIYEVSRIPTLLEVIDESNLIGLVPALALAHPSITRRFHHCAMVDPVIRRSVGCITSRDRPLSATAKAFRDLLLEMIGSGPYRDYPDIIMQYPHLPARTSRPHVARSRGEKAIRYA